VAAAYSTRFAGVSLFITLLSGAHAHAQSSKPSGIVDYPCQPSAAAWPAPGSDPPQVQALTEQVLTPGRKLDVDSLKAFFSSSEGEAFFQRMREQRERDWPNLCKYKAANELADSRPRVVFMGDSITENWAIADPALFSKGILGRGIGGQTTPQMLVRFYSDVIALRPKIVHLMAGTNDINGATGPTTLQDYKNNILAMLDLARANDIKVVLAAIPPARVFAASGIDPRPHIREINTWLKALANQRGLVFVDYGSVLADGDGGMSEAVTNDEVHPTRVGYAQMKPLAEKAIAQALKR
jgi:lysophospholipase L1-like esterase